MYDERRFERQTLIMKYQKEKAVEPKELIAAFQSCGLYSAMSSSPVVSNYVATTTTKKRKRSSHYYMPSGGPGEKTLTRGVKMSVFVSVGEFQLLPT